MPIFVPNRVQQPKMSLGYFDQVNNSSVDHVKALDQEMKKVQNVAQKADAPYQIAK